MLKKIGRNNQLYMMANFLFAFGTGLWLSLRPLDLADLGAAPQQIGLALAIGGISAGFLPRESSFGVSPWPPIRP